MKYVMPVNVVLIGTALTVCCRVYMTVHCPTVCLSHVSTAACHCGRFAAVDLVAGDNDQ